MPMTAPRWMTVTWAENRHVTRTSFSITTKTTATKAETATKTGTCHGQLRISQLSTKVKVSGDQK